MGSDRRNHDSQDIKHSEKVDTLGKGNFWPILRGMARVIWEKARNGNWAYAALGVPAEGGLRSEPRTAVPREALPDYRQNQSPDRQLL